MLPYFLYRMDLICNYLFWIFASISIRVVDLQAFLLVLSLSGFVIKVLSAPLSELSVFYFCLNLQMDFFRCQRTSLLASPIYHILELLPHFFTSDLKNPGECLNQSTVV